jgi:Flp pilus assembly pilin Flp
MLEMLRRLIPNRFAATLCEEEGQTLVEYSLVIVSVSLLCIALLTGIGHTITAMLNNTANGL